MWLLQECTSSREIFDDIYCPVLCHETEIAREQNRYNAFRRTSIQETCEKKSHAAILQHAPGYKFFSKHMRGKYACVLFNSRMCLTPNFLALSVCLSTTSTVNLWQNGVFFFGFASRVICFGCGCVLWEFWASWTGGQHKEEILIQAGCHFKWNLEKSTKDLINVAACFNPLFVFCSF